MKTRIFPETHTWNQHIYTISNNAKSPYKSRFLHIKISVLKHRGEDCLASHYCQSNYRSPSREKPGFLQCLWIELQSSWTRNSNETALRTFIRTHISPQKTEVFVDDFGVKSGIVTSHLLLRGMRAPSVKIDQRPIDSNQYLTDETLLWITAKLTENNIQH